MIILNCNSYMILDKLCHQLEVLLTTDTQWTGPVRCVEQTSFMVKNYHGALNLLDFMLGKNFTGNNKFCLHMLEVYRVVSLSRLGQFSEGNKFCCCTVDI